MQEIRIYVWTDASPFREDRCLVRYELQVIRPNSPTAFKTDGFTTTATQIGATLEGLVSALRRVKDGNEIPITIISKGMVTGIISSGQYLEWRERGWKTKKGEPVAYLNLWQEISTLIFAKTAHCSARTPIPEDEETINRLSEQKRKGKTA